MKTRKTWAWLRAIFAVILAAALLAATGFALGRWLGGPDVVTEGDALKNGAYVQTRLVHVMDVFAVERGVGGRAKAYFAVAPLGNRFVTIRFPASDFDNMTAMEAATKGFLDGSAARMDYSLVITGMVDQLGPDAAALLDQWFSENGPWMSQTGVISPVSDYSDYLSGLVIRSGDVGRMSFAASAALTAAALALLVYAAIIFIRIDLGRYDGKEKDHV